MMFGSKICMTIQNVLSTLFRVRQLQVCKKKRKKEEQMYCVLHVPCEIHSTANSIVSGIILIHVDLYVRTRHGGRYIIICITMYVLIFSLQACIEN